MSETSSSQRKILPPDVVALILSFCAEYGRESQRAPLNLAYVCQSWQQVALNTPSLWKYPKMNCKRLGGQRGQKDSLVERFFQRSQGTLVTFELTSCRPLMANEMLLIAQYARYVSSFTVNLNSFRLASHIFKSLKVVGFPNLEGFDCRFPDDDESFSFVWRKNDFLFRLPPVQGDLIQWINWVPPTTMTSVSFHFVDSRIRPPLREVRSILTSNCATLRHLEYQGFAPLPDYEPSFTTAVDFPALQTLEIGYVDAIVPFLDSIIQSTPALYSFSLRNVLTRPKTSHKRKGIDPPEPFYPFTDVPRLLSLLSTKQRLGNVREFSLFGINLPPAQSELNLTDSRLLFGAMPFSENLTLYGIHPDFSRALYDYKSKPGCPSLVRPRCPNLKRLVVTDCTYLAQFLRRRKEWGYPRLEKLVLTDECYQAMTLQEEVDVLADSSKEIFLIDNLKICEFTSMEERRL